MSDEEIMKALACCGEPYNICAGCPMPNNIKDDCRCGEHLANYALDIINRQQAEIERLKNEIQITKDAYIMLQTKNEIIKSEAIKEFAEGLKEIVKFTDDTYECWEIEGYINSLVKEMVGEE